MKKHLLVAATLISAATTSAQVSAYGFTQTSGTYGPVMTGTYIGDPTAFQEVIPVSLPFNFTFNGQTYTSFDVCSNGFLGFNSPGGWESNPISDNSTSEIISPFGGFLWKGLVTTGDISVGSNSITNVSFPGGISVGDSLQDLYGEFNSTIFKVTAISGSTIVINTTANTSTSGTDLFVLNGAIRHAVTGTTPNRVYTVEYRNFNRIVYNEMLTFKVKLYETSNKIEFLYGPMTIGTDYLPLEVGLKGSSNSDYKSRMVDNTNTWATSAAATSILDVCDFGPGVSPATGLTYIWAPSCVAPTVAIVPSTTVTCAGQPLVLTTGGNATTYTWTGSGSASQITVSPLSNTSYTLSGTSNNCTAQAIYNHSVAPNPTVTATAATSSVCSGITNTLTASGASSYTWVNIGTGVSQVITPTVTGTYTVIGEANGCSDQDQVTVTVDQGPTMQITQSHSVLCSNFNQSGTLTASGASSYNWNNGSSVTASFVITPSTTLVYTVTGAGANGCTRTQTITQVATICGGLAEAGRVTLVRAFPNPFQNNIVIENESNNVEIKVLDITGRVVHFNSYEGSGVTISTESWKPGLYFIEARHGAHVQTLKMVKQ